MDRYAVVEGSLSGHCCFDYSVVDLTKPVITPSGVDTGRHQQICECFEHDDAELICTALNAKRRDS